MAKEYGRRIAICITGLALYALGTVFGVFAGAAGTNGWNTMAIGLSNVTGMSFGTAVFAIGAALLAGVVMGAAFGIGTVLVIVLQASFFQFACRVCRFEPRSVINEDLADTVKRIRK